MMWRVLSRLSVVLLTVSCLASCSSGDKGKTVNKKKGKADTKQTAQADSATDENSESEAATEAVKPLTLGAVKEGASEDAKTVDLSIPPKREDVVKGLQPIQKVLIGGWNGIAKNVAATEVHKWIWDYKTDKVFPALVVQVPEGAFFTEARLTFDPRKNKYLMQTVDKEQAKHQFEGTFIADPIDVPGEDGKTLERTYKLELAEVGAEGSNTRWKFTLNQQNNNRYLIDVARARGKSEFKTHDVIAAQRQGTSFARADDDYGDRTCVISEGLGTTQVSYKGRSFWVCCSGCKAAFEDDPEGWIAKFEAKRKAAGK